MGAHSPAPLFLVDYIITHSFVHSGYFYSAPTSPLLLRGAPDTARILCRSFTPKRHVQATASEGLAQGPNVAARVEFEPTTLRTKGIQSTNEPPNLTPAVLHIFHMTHTTLITSPWQPLRKIVGMVNYFLQLQ